MSEPGFIKISNMKVPSTLRFGKKGLRLIEMKKMGLPVPDGIILSVEYLNRVIDTLNVEQKLHELWQLENDGNQDIDASAFEIFNNVKPAADIQSQLEHALKGLENFHNDMVFAVRSAALNEDDEDSSFAGQYATILNVTLSEIWQAIFRCYSSWWTDRAVIYRKQNNIKTSFPMLSIIIQHQLQPACSGVVFTRHPLKKTNTILVEAICGIGENLVSGGVSPARWEIDPVENRFISSQIESSDGIVDVNQKHLINLASIGQELEKQYGKGLDIEWAIENDILYFLQVRPITTSDSKINFGRLTENTYSRSIVEDLWSDRMTPITSSIIFDELSDLYTFKPLLRKLQLNEIAKHQAVKVINGYAYLNVQAVSELLELIPAALRVREVENIFPPSIREQVLKRAFIPSKILRIIHRIPLVLSDLAIVPFLTVPLLKRHLINIENELNEVPLNEYDGNSFEFYKNELERLLILLGRLQTRNQWGYGSATVFTWLAYHYATHFAGRSGAWVLQKINKIPDNVTLRIQAKMKEIAGACDEAIISRVFHEATGDERWNILQKEFSHHKVKHCMDDFISTYGCRSANRDFIFQRWYENPALVLDLLAIIVKSENPGARSEEPGDGAPDGLRLKDVFAAPVLWLLITLSRKFLALREDLRFGLDKVFYRLRRLLLAIGRHDQLKIMREFKDGILFLELNELRGLLNQEVAIDDFVSLVRTRMSDYNNCQNQSPPYYLKITGNDVISLEHAECKGMTIQGVAASPGVAEGTARVIYSDKEFHKLKRGDILIAHNTDPGWTPLFLAISGIVVEIGGILNHCAIVAREYNIPAVVGIVNVTKQINDGQRVRVNGNTGTVEILEP